MYPHNFKALEIADLSPRKIPSFKQQIEINTQDQIKKVEKSKHNRVDDRHVYFCVGYSKVWSKPIHVRIKKLVKQYKLTWLRFKMSYHRFSNFREMIGGSIDTKINENVVSQDFVDRSCNCSRTCLDNKGNCTYGGRCRNKCVVYCITCNSTGKQYIGATQQNAKARMSGHFADVKKLVCNNVRTDTYASHFSQFFNTSTNKPTPAKLRNISSFKILWQGKIISLMKIFGTSQ